VFSNNLSTIEDVSIFPIIGLVIFFLIFVFVIIRVLKTDKKYINKMENLPLEEENKLSINSEKKNEIE